MAALVRLAARSHASVRALSTYSEALSSTAQTKVTTLPNGVRVATEQTPHLTATIGLAVNSGSRVENEKNNGVAHFLEHMIFKGTDKRSQQALEEEVETIGAHLNAYTARDHTVYFAKCLAKDVAQVTDVLADAFTNSKFDPKLVEVERGTILREAQEIAHIPEEVVFDDLHAIAFQNNPLGRTILGSDDNIKSISAADIKSFIADNYTADRVVVSAVGGVDHDHIVKLAEQYFGKLPAKSSAAKGAKPAFTGADIRRRDDDIEEAHIAIAVEAVGYNHPDFFPLYVASTMIGQWDSAQSNGRHLTSRLAVDCTNRHIAHKFSSFFMPYEDTGLWGCYGVTPRTNVDDFVFELQAEWMALCVGPKESHVERAKYALRRQLLFALNGPTPIFTNIGQQLFKYGRIVSPAEIDAKVNAVTAKQVKEAATKYIYDKCPAVAAYGSTEAVPDYNRIRSGMFWLRN